MPAMQEITSPQTLIEAAVSPESSKNDAETLLGLRRGDEGRVDCRGGK